MGNVVGAVQGLLLGTTKLANGNTLQHLVDQATGNLVDKTLSTAGKVIAQKTVGSILDLPVVKETTNAAGSAVRQVKDQAGNLIEYTLDKATNKLSRNPDPQVVRWASGARVEDKPLCVLGGQCFLSARRERTAGVLVARPHRMKDCC